MRIGLGLAAVSMVLGALTWGLFRIGDVEDARVSSVEAIIAIPHSIRSLDLPELCETPLISRRRISCGGGACGPVYVLDFQARLDERALKDRLDLSGMQHSLNATDVELIPSSLPAATGCDRHYLFVYFHSEGQSLSPPDDPAQGG